MYNFVETLKYRNIFNNCSYQAFALVGEALVVSNQVAQVWVLLVICITDWLERYISARTAHIHCKIKEYLAFTLSIAII